MDSGATVGGTRERVASRGKGHVEGKFSRARPRGVVDLSSLLVGKDFRFSVDILFVEDSARNDIWRNIVINYYVMGRERERRGGTIQGRDSFDDRLPPYEPLCGEAPVRTAV